MTTLDINKYIEQLEKENKLLRQKLMDEIQRSNMLIMSERIKNDKLSRENFLLRQRNNYLTIIAG